MKPISRQARTILLFTFATVAIFVVAVIAGVEIASRDRILPGVVVLGQPLGGLTVDQATSRLTGPATTILDQPLQLQVNDRSWTTTPRAVGLKLDPAELAAQAFAFGHTASTVANLQTRIGALRTGTTLPVTSTSDGPALDELMKRVAAEVDTPAQAAQLSLDPDGTVHYQPSRTGLALDVVTSRALVSAALAEGRPSVSLAAQTLNPAVDTAQITAAHDQLAGLVADSSPIQVSAGQQHWVIDHAQVIQMISLTQPDAVHPTAAVNVNDDPLASLVQTYAVQVDTDPQTARFSWDGKQLGVLRQSHAGQALNQAAAVAQLKAAILSGQHTADLNVDVIQPAVAVDDASRLGIRELIGESTTSFAGSIPEKAHNIQLAAQRLNGVVVPPGGTFSFNKEVGSTTLEAGFEWGFGLTTGSQGGVHTVPSVAGGICQVATTLFQPVFWSGYQLEERYWHLYWIPSYTSRGIVGLDATVDADSGLDFKWINPTDQAVLIQASTDAEHITFRLYGQKPPWTVQVDDPVISDRVVADPTPEVQEEPSLPWGRTLLVESARDGFSVLLTRHVTPTDAAGQPRELALKSVYAPAHTVTLVGTNGAPDAHAVSIAVEQLRASQRPAASLAAPAAGAAATPGTTAAPATHQTPNGPRTIAQIRDELRQAGWGGGSDQDALETYDRVAGAAH